VTHTTGRHAPGHKGPPGDRLAAIAAIASRLGGLREAQAPAAPRPYPTTPGSDVRGRARHGRAPDGGAETAARPSRWSPSSVLRRILLPVLVFAGLKAIGFATFMLLETKSGRYLKASPAMGGGAHQWNVVGSWDGLWYEQIARLGYHPALVHLAKAPSYNPSLRFHMNSAAFFPLYSGLIRLVSDVTGLGLYGAGMAVSITASLVAAAGIYAVAEYLAGHRVGVIAAAIWAVFPGSGAEWAVYTESLYVALAAWACYCVIRKRWILAGLLVFAACLTRPTAVTLDVAIGVAALVSLVSSRWLGWWRPVTGTLLGPIGTIGFIAWVGWRMHQATGFFTLQSQAWGHGLDSGMSDLQQLVRAVTGEPIGYRTEVIVGGVFIVVLPVLVAMYLWLRPPAWLTVYVLLTIVSAVIVREYVNSVPRLVLTAFPLFAGPAAVMRRMHWLGLACCFVLLAIASGWYAGFVMFSLGVP
jgi:hypothetical protein